MLLGASIVVGVLAISSRAGESVRARAGAWTGSLHSEMRFEWTAPERRSCTSPWDVKLNLGVARDGSVWGVGRGVNPSPRSCTPSGGWTADVKTFDFEVYGRADPGRFVIRFVRREACRVELCAETDRWGFFPTHFGTGRGPPWLGPEIVIPTTSGVRANATIRLTRTVEYSWGSRGTATADDKVQLSRTGDMSAAPRRRSLELPTYGVASSPALPRAGAPFRVRLRTAVTTSLRVRCRASIARRALARPAGRARAAVATCRWTLPRRARGAKLLIAISVRDRVTGAHARKQLAYRVR